MRLLYCKSKAVQACEFALRAKELAACICNLLLGFRRFALLCFRVGFCLLECFGGICGVAFCGIQLARSLILLGNGTFPSGKCGVVGFLCLSKLGGESRKFLVGGILIALCCFRFAFRGRKVRLSCAYIFLCSSQRLLLSESVALRLFKLCVCLVQRLYGLRYGVLSVFYCFLLFRNALLRHLDRTLCFCLFCLGLFNVLLRCCCRLLLC